jgi:hypothetical protein
VEPISKNKKERELETFPEKRGRKRMPSREREREKKRYMGE